MAVKSGASRMVVVLLAATIGGVWVWYRKKASQPKIAMTLDALKDVKNLVPVAVIGSGPAGLSAALYTSRMNLRTVVFKGAMPGGQLTGTSYVENWPGVGTMLGPDIMKKFETHVEHFGAQFSADAIEKVDLAHWPFTLVTDDELEVHALSVVIATGSLPLRLGVDGEEAYWGRGVSTCAVCDAPFYKGREVIVVGGGDSAIEAATELAHGGAKMVMMLVRGDKLRASSVMQQRLKEYPAIQVRFKTNLKKVYGNDTHVTHVDLLDESKQVKKQAIDGVFLSIGHTPNSQLFKGQIALDEHDYITVMPHSQATSKRGVFVAGDVADYKYRQAGVASGDGIKAALDAIAFLREQGFTDALARNLEPNFLDMVQSAAAVVIPVVKASAEYDALVKDEKRPVVVDFYAPYCPSCMRMLPVIESVAARLQDGIKFIKIDVGAAPELAKRFNVPMIPTLLVFKEGKLLSRSTETMNKRQLFDYLQQFVASGR